VALAGACSIACLLPYVVGVRDPEILGPDPSAKVQPSPLRCASMRKAALGLIASAILVAIPATAAASRSAPPPGYWHKCRHDRQVLYMSVYRITCAYGDYVVDHGYKRRWVTRVGHFHCTRQRNAENTVWVNTCYRHHRRQGLFFDTY
jgi:hypothetical protein